MFIEHIRQYIKTIDKPDTPCNIDIVLEGGGFNGSYEYGVLHLIRERERHGILKVQRISGASIGSILGFCYAIDNLELYSKYLHVTQERFKQDGSFISCKNIIKETIDLLDDSLFKNIQKNKLFVTYFNINERKQYVQSEFLSKEDLFNSLLKSCYVPLLFDRNMALDIDKVYYADGGQPYIFESRSQYDNKILYVSINQISRLTNVFSLKGEKNQNNRIMEGLLDGMQFFTYGKRTTMCSYIQQWNIFDFIIIRIKQFILLIASHILYYTVYVTRQIDPRLKETTLYKIIHNIVSLFIKDTILLYCF